MSQDFINAVRTHDRTVIDRAGQAPPNLARELDEINSSLDAESREIAVELVARQDSQIAGTYILRRTDDDDANVATIAVEKLGVIMNKPSAAEIIGVVPKRKDPFIRGKLYLHLGKSTDAGVLEQLRQLEAGESDGEAKLQLLAARVKLGGKPEREELIGKIVATGPDDVLEMQGLMIYVNRPAIARGLTPWLDREDEVMRIGSDRQSMMARMNDVGVWTAHLLGIKLPFETTSLRNFTPEEIESTRKILQILPK